MSVVDDSVLPNGRKRAPFGQDAKNTVLTRAEWGRYKNDVNYRTSFTSCDSITVDGYVVRRRYGSVERLPPLLFDQALIDAVNACSE